MTDIKPDFSRVITTLRHEEPDRVPLAEVVIDCKIMSQFLGRTVADDDLASQVEFWSKAGYDFIPLTVGMMQPGRVTKHSQISKVIKDVMLKDTADEDSDEAWNVKRMALIHSEEDFEAFPWKEWQDWTSASSMRFSRIFQRE